VICYTDEYKQYAYGGFLLIAIYPVGIPLFFFYMLHRYRKRLHEVGVRAELGFLYGAYEKEVWYFELVDMLYKLFMIVLIAFVYDDYQLPVAIGLCILYLSVICWMKPFIRKSDDRLAELAQVEIFNLLLAGYCTVNAGGYGEVLDVILGVLLIISLLTFIAFFLLQSVMAVVKQVKDAKNKKAKQKALDKAIELGEKKTKLVNVKNDEVIQHVDARLADFVIERNPGFKIDSAIQAKGAAKDVIFTKNVLLERHSAEIKPKPVPEMKIERKQLELGQVQLAEIVAPKEEQKVYQFVPKAIQNYKPPEDDSENDDDDDDDQDDSNPDRNRDEKDDNDRME